MTEQELHDICLTILGRLDSKTSALVKEIHQKHKQAFIDEVEHFPHAIPMVEQMAYKEKRIEELRR